MARARCAPYFAIGLDHRRSSGCGGAAHRVLYDVHNPGVYHRWCSSADHDRAAASAFNGHHRRTGVSSGVPYALRRGLRENTDFLVSRLKHATIGIYGLEQYVATLDRVIDVTAALEVREVGEPGPWDYVIDDIVTPIEGVVGIEVERLAAGQTLI